MDLSPTSFEPSFDPRRWVVIAIVAALHVGMIGGLLSFGVRSRAPAQTSAMEVALIAEPVVAWSEGHPPQPQWLAPAITIEPPVIDLPPLESVPHSHPPMSRRAAPPAIAPAPAPQPKLVSQVQYLEPLRPHYPPTSRRLREEGVVMLLVLIDERGRASRVEVRDSSGFKRLDRAAQDAVEYARFRPYFENGIARPALVLIPVEFSLNARMARR